VVSVGTLLDASVEQSRVAFTLADRTEATTGGESTESRHWAASRSEG
jgi:hypothetical protein